MASAVFELSDKENAAPTKCALSPSKPRPAYSPGGSHISRPPRRPAALRSLLVETPSRPSYQIQMTKHWTSPTLHRPRSASPRRTLVNNFRKATGNIDRHTPDAENAQIRKVLDSSSAKSGEGGVLIDSFSRRQRIDSACCLIQSSSSSSECDVTSSRRAPLDDWSSLGDLEAAVASCFDSPSPSREERRKTLHLPSPGHVPSTSQHQSPQSSPSSSETWTGDDVFLPRSDVRARREVRVGQMRIPEGRSPQQQRTTVCPPGTTCSRSPLSQREPSVIRDVPRRSRFKIQAFKTSEVSIDRLPVRPASDADDEDEGSIVSSCGSE